MDIRPIDANALIVEQCGQCDGACETFDGEKCLACKTDCHCDLREAIDNAPTIDYEPVVHGKWDDNIVPFCNVCSVCKVYVDRGCFPTVRHKGIVLPNIGALNYCPNCGARMDAKEE